MRAFHFSWMCFFTAFFIWFAIAPLLPEVKITLGLTKQQLWTSNICSVAGTIFMRFVNGPLCDKYGARILMGVILAAASIPCALTGLVQTAGQLYALRFAIGLGGSTFVMCQYWTSRMFTKEVAVSYLCPVPVCTLKHLSHVFLLSLPRVLRMLLLVDGEILEVESLNLLWDLCSSLSSSRLV